MHSEMTISILQRLGWVINFEKSDLTLSQDFQFLRMQFNTRQFTVAPLPKMRLKVQSVHHHWMSNPIITARDLHRLLGMVVFMATLVCRGRPVVSRHSMVPEDRKLDRQDHSSSVGSARSGLVGITCSPCHSGNGSHASNSAGEPN